MKTSWHLSSEAIVDFGWQAKLYNHENLCIFTIFCWAKAYSYLRLATNPEKDESDHVSRRHCTMWCLDNRTTKANINFSHVCPCCLECNECIPPWLEVRKLELTAVNAVSIFFSPIVLVHLCSVSRSLRFD
jgi:hypothetical protein